MPTISDELNQPRYWSGPSIYTSEGQGNPRSATSTASEDEPESNQTSRMSVSFVNSEPLQFGQVKPSGRRYSGSRAYHASAVSLANIEDTLSITFSSAIVVLHFVQ